MVGVNKYFFFRKLFNKLPLPIEYLFRLPSFIVESMDRIQADPELHDLQMPNADFVIYEKGLYCAGTKCSSIEH